MQSLAEGMKELMKQIAIKRYGSVEALKKIDISEGRRKLQEQTQSEVREYFKKQKREYFKKHSLTSSMQRLDDKFKKVKSLGQPFDTLAKKAVEIAQDYTNGKRYTTILTGNPGSGKTMLAICIANAVSKHEIKAVYVSIVEYASIIMDFNNPKRDTTIELIEKTVKNADLVILDDLGRESSMGKISNTTTTVQSRLYKLFNIILDEAQENALMSNIGERSKGKAVIITTNNTGDEFKRMYDGSVVSRMFANKKHVLDFKGVSDYRSRDISK